MPKSVSIFQSGGFTPFYVVRDPTGRDLWSSPWLFGALATKVWCWRHGYHWPTAAQMNGVGMVTAR